MYRVYKAYRDYRVYRGLWVASSGIRGFRGFGQGAASALYGEFPKIGGRVPLKGSYKGSIRVL